MGVKVSPLGSDAVVEISEENVDQYLAQGWTRAGEEVREEVKRGPGRPSKSDK